MKMYDHLHKYLRPSFITQQTRCRMPILLFTLQCQTCYH